MKGSKGLPAGTPRNSNVLHPRGAFQRDGDGQGEFPAACCPIGRAARIMSSSRIHSLSGTLNPL